jgi:MFS superfamily sulfate permease-like transporter
MFPGTARHRARGTEASAQVRFTPADGYRTVTSALMVMVGAVIVARTLPFGFHLIAVLVGLGFIGLGAYRLSFVIAYFRRSRSG